MFANQKRQITKTKNQILNAAIPILVVVGGVAWLMSPDPPPAPKSDSITEARVVVPRSEPQGPVVSEPVNTVIPQTGPADSPMTETAVLSAVEDGEVVTELSVEDAAELAAMPAVTIFQVDSSETKGSTLFVHCTYRGDTEAYDREDLLRSAIIDTSEIPPGQKFKVSVFAGVNPEAAWAVIRGTDIRTANFAFYDSRLTEKRLARAAKPEAEKKPAQEIDYTRPAVATRPPSAPYLCTPDGECYHRSGCRTIKGHTTYATNGAGLRRCKVCL